MRELDHGFLWIGLGAAFVGIVTQAISPGDMPPWLLGVMAVLSAAFIVIGFAILWSSVRRDIEIRRRSYSFRFVEFDAPIPGWKTDPAPDIHLRYAKYHNEDGRLEVENRGEATLLTCSVDFASANGGTHRTFSNVVAPWIGSDDTSIKLPRGGKRSIRLFSYSMDVATDVPGFPVVTSKINLREAGSDDPVWSMKRDLLVETEPFDLTMKVTLVGDSQEYGPMTSYWRVQETPHGLDCDRIELSEVSELLSDSIARLKAEVAALSNDDAEASADDA